MHWKDMLYFQRNSKTAVILLLVLIVLTLILNSLLNFRRSSPQIYVNNDSLVREFESFQHELKVNKKITATPSVKSRPTERSTSKTQHSSVTNGSPVVSSQPTAADGVHTRKVYPTVQKLALGETIQLNEADTTQWKKIPGIGSAYASRIVNYRDLLGGFERKEQLMEVYGIDQGLYSQIEKYVEPDGVFQKILVNQSEFRELLRHPYLNYDQVKMIMNIRRKKGTVNSIGELSILDEFTPEDISRLEPYLSF